MDCLAEYLKSSSPKKRRNENQFTLSFRVSKNTKVRIECLLERGEAEGEYIEKHTNVFLSYKERSIAFSKKYTSEEQPHIPIKGIIEMVIAWDYVVSHLTSKKCKKQHHLLRMDKEILIGDDQREGILFSRFPCTKDIKKLNMHKHFGYAISHAIWYDDYSRRHKKDTFEGFLCRCGIKNKVCQCLAAPVFAIAYLPKLLKDFRLFRREKRQERIAEKQNIFSAPLIPGTKNPMSLE